MDVPVLHTERLTMRAPRLEDFDAMYGRWSDPLVMRYMGGKPLTDTEVWSRLMRNAGNWELLAYGMWMVEERSTDRAIGEVGFFNARREIDPAMRSSPEAGWVFSPDVHGKGLGSEAVGAAVQWADARPFERTVCIIDPENEPSLRLARKNGYRSFKQATFMDGPAMFLERLHPGTTE